MEIWKDIEGYEGLYQVSNEGRVKSLGYDKTKKEKVLKTIAKNSGYVCVELWKYGKRKKYYIHRLVATAFIENQQNNLEINHKDEDKGNNYVHINEDGSVNLEKSNIEWCTRKYNNNYGTHNQKVSEALSIQVGMLTKEGKLIGQFTSSIEAEKWLKKNGFPKASRSAIIHCCNGSRKTAYGFKWVH